MEEGGLRRVGLTDADDPQLVALQVDRFGRQELRQHLLRGGRHLAWEDPRPVPGHAGVSRFELGAAENLSCRQAFGEPYDVRWRNGRRNLSARLGGFDCRETTMVRLSLAGTGPRTEAALEASPVTRRASSGYSTA
jgi:hypothetical protein